MNSLRRFVRRFTRRRQLRVARDFDILLQILDDHPPARKALRRVLRVRSYENGK